MAKIMIDVLIVGNGGAGLSAALSAKQNVKNVTVLSKTYPTSSQTSQAQGGINAVFEESKEDSVQIHINDTIKSAKNIGSPQAIKYMCEESSNAINWLSDMGMPFTKDENAQYCKRALGGASFKRTHYSSDYSGLKILHTLYDQCLKEDITFMNEFMMLDLIIKDNTVKGIVAMNLKTSEVVQVLAKTVVLATGGYAGIYNNYTTNGTATTSDAIAIALKSGCEISNLEYVQFHPTALSPNHILISESARGEGGYLVNSDDERFVDELKPRDEVARAIYTQIQNGKKVYLDVRHLGLDKILNTIPQEYEIVKDFLAIEIDKELIPIVPSAHYSMGGIKTTKEGETNIQNLFAVGECSSNGVHGANRLGGNSLLEIIVFGKLVGKTSAEKSKNILNEEETYENLNQAKQNIANLFEYENSISFYDAKEELGALMYENVGLFRDEKNLNIALKKIQDFQAKYNKMGVSHKETQGYNSNLKEFIEFGYMLETCEAVVLCAINRKESRGAHFRSDFVNSSDKYEQISIIKNENGTLNVELNKGLK